MRNLKKVLSLVLVVAMLASMMIVGAAAANEAEETQYPEAAAVIAGIGVMEGDDDGMRYGDTVSREEAATIICRILLGDSAETLKTTTAPFEDVAANRWSAGYIAYLKTKGIVSGVTDTKFDPTAEVTGIQFAKMLLTAVGYGKAGEFDGDGWDINTITLSNEKGIYATTKAADLTAAATREECMLYAFNTVTKVPTVKYSKNDEEYYTGSTAGTAVKPTDEAELAKWTLGATKFELVRGTTNDAFGNPLVTYTRKGDEKPLASIETAPNFTLENAVTGATLYAKLGATKVDKVVLKVDGENVTKVKDASGADVAVDKDIIAEKGTASIAAQGATTQGYISLEDGKTVLTLVVNYEYIGKVQKVDATTGEVTFENPAVANTDEITCKIAGLAKDDIVIYTKADGKVVTAEKAAPVTGAYQSSKTAFGVTQYVIGGNTYVMSAKKVGDAPATFDAAYDVYTDSLGNVLWASAVKTAEVVSNDYLYVAASKFTAAVNDGFTNIPAVAQLNVVYANGGQAIVNYTVVNGKVTLPGSKDAAVIDSKMTVSTGWYSYVEAEDGSVSLIKAAKDEDAKKVVTSDKLTLAKGAYTVNVGTAGNKNATAKTVLNIVNKKGEVLTYTGYAQFPAKTEASYETMYTLDQDGRIVAINAYAGEEVFKPEENKVYGYCAAESYTDGKGTHYTFYVDGKTVDVVKKIVEEKDKLVPGTAYEMSETNGVYAAGKVYADGVAKDPTTGYPTANTIKYVDDQYFDLKDGTTVSYNALTKVYDVANGGALTTLTEAANNRGIIYKVNAGVVVNAWLLP